MLTIIKPSYVSLIIAYFTPFYSCDFWNGCRDDSLIPIHDPEWRFLGEYPLNELMIEMDNRDRTNASVLLQTIKDMGIHPEHLSNIESKLIGFAKEAMAHLNQGRSESPVYIRLFYQKKSIEDLNSVKSSSQLNAESPVESKQIIHQSDAGINGGWGYFLIERGGDFLPSSSVSTCNWIDLYLYKEGE